MIGNHISVPLRIPQKEKAIFYENGKIETTCAELTNNNNASTFSWHMDGWCLWIITFTWVK